MPNSRLETHQRARGDSVTGVGEQTSVSFIIPVKNDAVRLRRCLASIADNTYPATLIEMVVVDNGSTDSSADTARNFGANVVSMPKGSVAALRNRGVSESRGAIVAFVDADHEIDRHWAAAAVDVLSQPDVAATGAPCATQPKPTWVQQQYDAMRTPLLAATDVEWLGSGNLAMTRDAFERIGGFDENLTACEDVDLCNRLRLSGKRIIADPRLRNVHFGDPPTLRALFLGELWRGRDNVRVTFRGPWTFRHLRSAVAPIGSLAAMTMALAALVAGRTEWFLGLVLAAFIPALINTLRICRRRQTFGAIAAAQALAVAVVFDQARALSLVFRGSHKARRVT